LCPNSAQYEFFRTFAAAISRSRDYSSNAELKGQFCLRACIVNHQTTDDDIDVVMPEVVAAASEVAAKK
jgi:hypothetical protein